MEQEIFEEKATDAMAQQIIMADIQAKQAQLAAQLQGAGRGAPQPSAQPGSQGVPPEMLQNPGMPAEVPNLPVEQTSAVEASGAYPGGQIGPEQPLTGPLPPRQQMMGGA
jgi:hypothetical protein